MAAETVRPLDVHAVDLVRLQRDGVVIQDAAGRVIDHNPAALIVLQMTSDELFGHTSLDPAWAAVTADGEPLDGTRHPAMRVLATGIAVDGFVMGVQSGRSVQRWLRVDSWPIKLDDGTDGVLSQFADITVETEQRARIDIALDRLQRNALPPGDVQIPGLEVWVRYRSVTAPLQIGGDFCDVYPIDNDRFGFFIGDACGHDIDTVSTTMVAHHTLRAAGIHLTRPGRVLVWLDDTLKATPDTVYCSAIHGTLTIVRNGDNDTVESVTVEFANAGHPRPIHLNRDGVDVLEPAGTLVHAVPSFEEPPTVTVNLDPGDEIVFYTDGLIESPSPRVSDEQLVDNLRKNARRGNIAIEVANAMMAAADNSPRSDDTAVLIVRRK